MPILDIWSHFFVSLLLLYYWGGGGVNGKESESEVLQICLKAQKMANLDIWSHFFYFSTFLLGDCVCGGEGMVEEVDVDAFRCD